MINVIIHVCDVKNCDLKHDLLRAVNGGVISPFRERVIVAKFRENNILTKISEFTVFYASVTFAKVVVRFICLRFSLRFFGIVGGYKLRRMCLHCLRSPYDFFRRQTRTKPYRDLVDIVRQLQGYRTIIVYLHDLPI